MVFYLLSASGHNPVTQKGSVTNPTLYVKLIVVKPCSDFPNVTDYYKDGQELSPPAAYRRAVGTNTT
jgi:hypothetical protein